jgi:AcrR family transcriptional regulator
MADAREELMAATHRALCEHGYADLTTKRIAAEADVTTAALHYHFDTKEALLTAFLEYLLDRTRARFDERIAGAEATGPVARLRAFLDEIFAPHTGEGADGVETALLEIKAQAPYDAAFRRKLKDHDEYMRGVLRDCIREGIESGVFGETDPDVAARFMVTVINGAHVRQVALGEDPALARAALADYVETNLLASDAEVSLA